MKREVVNYVFKLGGNVHAFDSTTIDLFLNVFNRPNSGKRKEKLKTRSLYNLENKVLSLLYITTVLAHDVNAMDTIP